MNFGNKSKLGKKKRPNKTNHKPNPKSQSNSLSPLASVICPQPLHKTSSSKWLLQCISERLLRLTYFERGQWDLREVACLLAETTGTLPRIQTNPMGDLAPVGFTWLHRDPLKGFLGAPSSFLVPFCIEENHLALVLASAVIWVGNLGGISCYHSVVFGSPVYPARTDGFPY